MEDPSHGHGQCWSPSHASAPSSANRVHGRSPLFDGSRGLIELGHNEPNPLQLEPHRPVPLDGKTVLVNGAAGGAGHFAVQLVKWQGAHVVAVASGTQESFVRALGADEFIDYTKRPPEGIAQDVDLVLDTLGGPTTGRFLRTLKPGGALFPVFPSFSGIQGAAELGVTVSMTQVRSNGMQLVELGRCFMPGRFASPSTARFSLPMLTKRTNEPLVGTFKARSCFRSRKNATTASSYDAQHCS